MAKKRRSFGQIMAGTKPGNWKVRWIEFGRSRQQTVTGTKALARQVLAKMEAKIGQAEALGVRPVERLTFKALVDRYEDLFRGEKKECTILREASLLRNQVAPFFGTMAVDAIRRDDIERYLQKRMTADQISPATRNRTLSILSRLFKKAVGLNHARTNPCAGIQRSREALKSVPVLSVAEQAKLAQAVQDDAMRALVTVLFDTGMRLGEALRVEWSDVDWIRKVVTVRESKNGRPRYVPLTSRGASALQGLAEQREPRVPDHVFAGMSAITSMGEPQLRAHYRAAWKKACKVFGMPGLRLHDLRHVYAVTALRAGTPLSDLREALGHSSLTMVLRYARHCPENAPELTRQRLEAFLTKGDDERAAVGS